MHINMNKLVHTAALLLAGSSLTTADVAPGFPLSGGPSNLTVIYNSNDTVSPPGELLPRPATAQRPSIAYPVQASTPSNVNTTQKYLLFLIDIDVPRNNTRVPLLHWLAPNTTLSTFAYGPYTPFLAIPDQNPVPYVQPSPPVGDIPHAYTFVLLAQPEGFRIPERYANLSANRVGFDVRGFLSDVGIGTEGVVLASNWIRVQNTSGVATGTGFPPPRQTGNAGGNASAGGGYQGPESNEGVVVGRGVWMGLGTVVLVGVGAVLL